MGYVPPSQKWRTVMAYETQCPNGCPRIPYWSNPELTYDNEPMGIPEGQPKAADNAKTLNTTAITVANFRQHVTAPPQPAPPTPISPQGTITTRLPTYSWAAVPYAESYLVWVDDASGKNIFKQWFNAPKVCASATCVATPPVQLENVAHTWFVKAWNSTGTNGWSTPVAFTVNGVPNAPNLLAPANGATNVPQPIKFQWYRETNATSYDLQVLQGKSIVIDQQGILDSQACSGSVCQDTLQQILNGGTYTWKVRGCNAAGCGSWSVQWTFTVPPNIPTPPPIPISPSGSTTPNPPTFVWSQSNGANYYEVKTDGVNVVYSRTVRVDLVPPAPGLTCVPGGNCSYPWPGVLPTPLSTNNYVWQVRACNNSYGCTVWSQQRGFSLPGPQPRIVAKSPYGNITQNPPKFVWSWVSWVVKYRLIVVDTTTWQTYTWYFPPEYLDCIWFPPGPGGDCTFTPKPPFTFPVGHQYVWQVEACDTTGWCQGSNQLRFIIIPPPVDDGFVSPPWDKWCGYSGWWSVTPSNTYKGVVTTTRPSWITAVYCAKDFNANIYYEAKMRRTGCSSCAYGINIRGVPYDHDGGWYTTYQFSIRNDGSFAVWKMLTGNESMLQNWTYTPVIRPGDWNALRVVALGERMYFYINDVLVWSGIDPYYPPLSSGKVGVHLYGYQGDTLELLNARATIPTSTLSMPEVSAEQKALNAEANQKPAGSSQGEKPE